MFKRFSTVHDTVRSSGYSRMIRFCLMVMAMQLITHGVYAKDRFEKNAGQAPPRAEASVTTPSVVSTHGSVKGFRNARLRSDGAFVVQGHVSGKGKVNADHVILEGIVSPGNSPGCISFGGNVTFSFTATLVMEVGGTVPCSEYDQLTVANTLTINSATLQVIPFNAFAPSFGQRFDILDWGTLTGTFATVDTSAYLLPSPLIWDTSELYLTGELIVGVQAFADGDLAPLGAPDGLINAADIMIATRIVVGDLTPGPLEYAHGDMNSDGVIDMPDLLLIYKLVFP